MKHTQVSLYADDTVLYCFSDNPFDLEEQLNADLHTVCDCRLRDNKLTLKIKKTKAMVNGSNRKLSNTSSVTVHVNGNTIENVEHFSYLGVTLSTTMTWNEHVTNLSSKVNKRLGLLKRIRHLRPKKPSLNRVKKVCNRSKDVKTKFSNAFSVPGIFFDQTLFPDFCVV